MKPRRTAENLSPAELSYVNQLLSSTDRGLLDRFPELDDETPVDIAKDRVDHWQGGKKIASYREAV